uniref:Uncharacterized protein n=1 Tax=Xiphophorus couchianus TaxID=32473 RepID=A0A3B5KY11_9TELE
MVVGRCVPVAGSAVRSSPGVVAARRPLQAGAAHAFSRWLTCLRQSLHLNQLLRFPLPEPQCCRLYCGPWLHQLQNQLLTDSNAFRESRERLQDGERELLDRALTVIQSAGQEADEELARGKQKKKREGV